MKPGTPEATARTRFAALCGMAAPFTWEELEDPGIHSRSFTIRNLIERLERKGDLWKGFHERGQPLADVIQNLRKKK